MKALRMHTRLFGALTIARRHPRLFSRLLRLELEPRRSPTQKTHGDAMPHASATNRRLPAVTAIAIAAAAAAALSATAAGAATIDTSNPELSLRWDTSLKYSVAGRLKSADAVLGASANGDDGDHNFGKGPISNRVDLFTEVDAVWQGGWGARVSAAAYYDRAYNTTNDNPGFAGGAFPNQLSVPANEFPDATRRLHGRKAEALDAFAFGKFTFGEMAATVRAGRHSVLWGESLFFGGNAISGGQQPVDVVKLLSVPNTQFKEAIRPVPQISGQLQISQNVSLGAYVQTSWKSNRVPAAGSYFSNTDPAIDGGETILLGPGVVALRQPDRTPKSSGQAGLQLRLRTGDTDFGLYAIRFHSKAPQLIPLIGLTPVGPAPVAYYLAYQQDIKAVGASASRTFGDFNVAVEASVRSNQDLASTQGADVSAIAPVPPTNVTDNPGYAVGRTAHVNLSTVASFGPSLLWNEATLFGEIAWNRTLSVTKNAAALDPHGTRDGVALRALFEPTYRGVADGLDVGVPLGLGWAPKGARPLAAYHPNAWIPEGGGDASIGLKGAYRDAWRATLSYTHYFGTAAPLTDAAAGNAYTWKQTLRDRDFIAASLSYSF
jgi:hypothetical protein